MKNLKLSLSAFAVVAFVSGAFALKAHTRLSPTIFCETSGQLNGACPSGDGVNYIEGGTLSDPCAPSKVAHINFGGNCVNSSASGFTFND